ncbi:MAG TPA: rRNA adenine methyltransferase [Chitinophagaceae bacterium]|nr:rRNA adenine methyltransferase [Chitinophagaceae bacterium]
MDFNPRNNVVRLCARGMNEEALGNMESAFQLYLEAWEKAISDFEKFTAAHYLGRHQEEPHECLYWNEQALHFALRIDEETSREHLSSLYLNIGKSYETLHNFFKARQHYQLAAAFIHHLPNDEHGRKVRAGVEAALIRIDAMF